MQNPKFPSPVQHSRRKSRDLFSEFLAALHRNSVCTEELVEEICRGIERYGLCDDSAAGLCSVSRKDLARWKQEDGELQSRFDAAREAFEERMLQRIRSYCQKAPAKRKAASRLLGRPFQSLPTPKNNSGL